jgi:hypothetical protein
MEWPEFKFPPINLLCCPAKPDLSKHEDFIEILEHSVRVSKLSIDSKTKRIEFHKRKISDKNFVYFLRCGRFPDE